jgi:hypothetical protein
MSAATPMVGLTTADSSGVAATADHWAHLPAGGGVAEKIPVAAAAVGSMPMATGPQPDGPSTSLPPALSVVVVAVVVAVVVDGALAAAGVVAIVGGTASITVVGVAPAVPVMVRSQPTKTVPSRLAAITVMARALVLTVPSVWCGRRGA